MPGLFATSDPCKVVFEFHDRDRLYLDSLSLLAVPHTRLVAIAGICPIVVSDGSGLDFPIRADHSTEI